MEKKPEAKKENSKTRDGWSIRQVAIYFLGTLILYVVAFAYSVFDALTWPKEGKLVCSTGGGMTCYIEPCPSFVGVFPTIALVLLLLCIVSYALRWRYAEKKKTLTEFSMGMLLGAIFGIFAGAIFARALGSLLLGLLGFSSC